MPIFQRGNFETAYIWGGAFVLMIFLFSGMRYIISGSKLLLKIWFIPCGSVNILDIVSIERTYDPTSSPAASLKRLRVHFEKGKKYSNWMTWQSSPNWLISPVREQEFIEKLSAINPDIYIKIDDKKEWWRIWNWDI